MQTGAVLAGGGEALLEFIQAAVEQSHAGLRGVLALQGEHAGRIDVGGFEDLGAAEGFGPAHALAHFGLQEELLLVPIAAEDGAGRGHFGEGGRAFVGTRAIHGSARALLPAEREIAAARLQRGGAQQVDFEIAGGDGGGIAGADEAHFVAAAGAQRLLFDALRGTPRHALRL